MKENNFYDKIDDYILGRLDDPGTKKFRQAIESDNELAQAVRIRQILMEGLEAEGRNEMKTQLKNIHQEVIPPTPIVPMKKRRLLHYIAAAAAILMLAIAIFKLNTNGVDQSSGELYAAYFKPYDISSMQRAAADDAMIEIQRLYNNKQYVDVLPLLEARLNTLDTKPSSLLLVKGITLLETNQPQKALAEFGLVTAANDFNFEDEINWYSSLAYLKMNDTTNARKLLQLLAADSKTDHHVEAKQLLDAMSE